MFASAQPRVGCAGRAASAKVPQRLAYSRSPWSLPSWSQASGVPMFPKDRAVCSQLTWQLCRVFALGPWLIGVPF